MTTIRRLCYSLRQHVGTLFTGPEAPVLDLTPCESRLRREVQTLLALEMQAAIRETRPDPTRPSSSAKSSATPRAGAARSGEAWRRGSLTTLCKESLGECGIYTGDDRRIYIG